MCIRDSAHAVACRARIVGASAHILPHSQLLAVLQLSLIHISDGNYTLDLYTCHDQSKVTTGSITADYTKQEDLTLTFADVYKRQLYM